MKKHERPKAPGKRPAHYLREWRKLRGLTQDRLGERVNMDKGSISRLENFETKYTEETLETLAFALDVDPADLLSPPSDPARPETDITRQLKKIKDREELARVGRMISAYLGEKKA